MKWTMWHWLGEHEQRFVYVWAVGPLYAYETHMTACNGHGYHAWLKAFKEVV